MVKAAKFTNEKKISCNFIDVGGEVLYVTNAPSALPGMVQMITMKNMIPISVPLKSTASFKYVTETRVKAFVPSTYIYKGTISKVSIIFQNRLLLFHLNEINSPASAKSTAKRYQPRDDA